MSCFTCQRVLCPVRQGTNECHAAPQRGDVYYPVLQHSSQCALCPAMLWVHRAQSPHITYSSQTPLPTTAPLEPFQNVVSDDELKCQGTESKDSNHGSVCSSCQIHSQHPLKSIFLGNVNVVPSLSLKIRMLPAPLATTGVNFPSFLLLLTAPCQFYIQVSFSFSTKAHFPLSAAPSKI